MKRLLVASAVTAAIIASIGAASVTAAPAGSAVAIIPEKAADFELADTSRLAHRLSYFRYAPAIVVMTQSNGSAVSRAGAAEMARLQEAYKAQGVLFYMLNSNAAQTRDQAGAEAAAQKFAVTVLKDDLQLVGEQLGVQREGEVYVLDPKNGFKVAYHGPLDDRFNSNKPNLSAKAKNAWTANAIDAVLAQKAVAEARVDMKAGQLIAFPERKPHDAYAEISYSKVIAPMIAEKCGSCHVKGGIGPFQLTSYEVVKNFAPMIRETVMTKRMPPWGADPHVGAWSNDSSLTAAEQKALIRWIEGGAQRGDGPDILKTAVKEAPEWPVALGKPDVIVDLPAFTVPASGIIDYQSVSVNNPFKEDAWLRAVAFKPGARPVLHHITSSYAADRTQPAAKIPGSSVGSYVPGAGIQTYNDGTGAPVPVGGKLRYSLHYTATGKEMTDRTQIGYYLLKTPPNIIRRAAVISNPGLYIPAGEQRHVQYSYLEFPADALLYSVHPHAHFRGYSVELTKITPDGKETPVLSVPRYDFNWQLDYDLKEPMLIKKGTKLRVRYVYDNSAHNRANPDPKINVKWGEQTWEEMLYFRVNYRWVDETSKNVRNDLQEALMETRTMGVADVNADGKLQPAELTGSLASLKVKFAELDKNKDGAIDKIELAASKDAAAAGRRIVNADNDL